MADSRRKACEPPKMEEFLERAIVVCGEKKEYCLMDLFLLLLWALNLLSPAMNQDP